MSELQLSSDIRDRFVEMRERLARLERSVSPHTEYRSDTPRALSQSNHVTPAATLSQQLDADTLTERIVASLTPDKAHSVNPERDLSQTASNPFEAIQSRLLRKLNMMEATRRGFSSASAVSASYSPEVPSERLSASQPLDHENGASPVSPAGTEPKSPSPCVREQDMTVRMSPERASPLHVVQSRPAASDSPLPTNPVSVQRQEAARDTNPASEVRALFVDPEVPRRSSSGRPVSKPTRSVRATPTMRFSDEATILEPLNTAELLCLLRLRGLVSTERNIHEEPLGAPRCHVMYISAVEQSQLIHFRAAVLRKSASTPQAGSRNGRESESQRRPETLSVRKPSTSSARRPAASHSSFGHPVRASAPTASSLSKTKKTSYF